MRDERKKQDADVKSADREEKGRLLSSSAQKMKSVGRVGRVFFVLEESVCVKAPSVRRANVSEKGWRGREPLRVL